MIALRWQLVTDENRGDAYLSPWIEDADGTWFLEYCVIENGPWLPVPVALEAAVHLGRVGPQPERRPGALEHGGDENPYG